MTGKFLLNRMSTIKQKERPLLSITHKSLMESFLGTSVISLPIYWLMLLVWFLIKTLEVPVRMWVDHPNEKFLWLTSVILMLGVLGIADREGETLFFNLLTLFGLVLLVITAKVIDLIYDDLLQMEMDRETIVYRMLHEPWFNLKRYW